MRHRLVTIVLLTGLSFSLAALVPRLRGFPPPGYHTGYEPVW